MTILDWLLFIFFVLPIGIILWMGVLLIIKTYRGNK